MLPKRFQETRPSGSQPGAFLLWGRRLLISAPLGFIGLAGIPDDMETWERWIDEIMKDPLVTDLAERVVAIAEVVNNHWVRGSLIAVAALILVWSLRQRQ